MSVTHADIQAAEKARRRERFELGISSAQRGKRIPAKGKFTKASRADWKRGV